MTPTNNSRNTSTHHLLMVKAVLHFKWVNSYQPSKRWKAKEQLVLTTSHLHFSSHSSLSSSRNYNPYSTHHFRLLTAHESGALPQSFQYSKLRNPPVKSPLSVQSVWHHVPSNLWNAFLLTVSTKLRKPTTCSVNSKSVFVKDGAVRMRLLE